MNTDACLNGAGHTLMLVIIRQSVSSPWGADLVVMLMHGWWSLPHPWIADIALQVACKELQIRVLATHLLCPGYGCCAHGGLNAGCKLAVRPCAPLHNGTASESPVLNCQKCASEAHRLLRKTA